MKTMLYNAMIRALYHWLSNGDLFQSSPPSSSKYVNQSVSFMVIATAISVTSTLNLCFPRAVQQQRWVEMDLLINERGEQFAQLRRQSSAWKRVAVINRVSP